MNRGPRTALGPIRPPDEAPPPPDASTVRDFSYIDAEIRRMEAGAEPPPYWRAFHWGLYADPEDPDTSLAGYVQAGEAMTAHVVDAAGVADGHRVLDVGCGFGGTVDHVRATRAGAWAVGLNIDERQLRQARRLLDRHGRGHGAPAPFVTADGCRLPAADASFDHVLAVECVFHFPSRKQFFREVARVLRPGGTLALSDFVVAPGALTALTAVTTVSTSGGGANEAPHEAGSFFGHATRPVTSAGYARLGRAVGLEPVVDDDVTARTLPTYGALRRIYAVQGAVEGVAAVDYAEALARTGGWQYHVIAFRKPAAPPT